MSVDRPYADPPGSLPPSSPPPTPGQVVRVRHGDWLVERVVPPPGPGQATLVAMVCLDDGDPGRPLEVLWEIEAGARVLAPQTDGLGEVRGLTPARVFEARLRARAWGAVSAVDPERMHAPFRAGIQVLAHQLVPLRRALARARVELLLADEVGLGKTIEAGLITAELLAHQRLDFVLVVCPAAVCLQWREQFARRFGLRFEIYNRAFASRSRRERGFAVNPWATGGRFIVSYATLRRPEHRDPLLHSLAVRDPSGAGAKSLLILDEAHVVTGGAGGLGRVAADVAPRFEHRLLLSATPYDGRAGSLGRLLEHLDPLRFYSGVEVTSEQLARVMIRHRKQDLRALDPELARLFPQREIVRHVVEPTSGELELARALRAYRAACADGVELDAAARRTFATLQCRMLSSAAALLRGLEVHAGASRRAKADRTIPDRLPNLDDSAHGEDQEALDARARAELAAGSSGLELRAAARALLDEVLERGRVSATAVEGKLLGLLAWIRENQCGGVGPDGLAEDADAGAREWSSRRVVVFTQYGETKRWLVARLSAAIAGSAGADQRIMVFHGGMSDRQRAEVRRAFNGDPKRHPVRILVCTDAAREGVDLQGRCADLFHYDLPWQAVRIDQRSGRLDRALQAEPVVRCHHFVLRGRDEDRALDALVSASEAVRVELGSQAGSALGRLSAALSGGIDAGTIDRLAAARREIDDAQDVSARATEQPAQARAELEASREALARSRRAVGVDPQALRETIDVGLELAGVGPLREIEGEASQGVARFEIDELPIAWAYDDELEGEPWPAGRALVFEAPARLAEDREQLHLAHPFVERVLARLRRSGEVGEVRDGIEHGSRVTWARSSQVARPRVAALARACVFGVQAARLHEALIVVVGDHDEASGEGGRGVDGEGLTGGAAALKLVERALSEAARAVPDPAHRERLRAAAPGEFSRLWPALVAEFDQVCSAADRGLAARASRECEGLIDELDDGSARIEAALARSRTDDDRARFGRRLEALARARAQGPDRVRARYTVGLRRLEPIGLVYLWPRESR